MFCRAVADSSNLLTDIIKGLETLHSENVSISKDGTLIAKTTKAKREDDVINSQPKEELKQNRELYQGRRKDVNSSSKSLCLNAYSSNDESCSSFSVDKLGCKERDVQPSTFPTNHKHSLMHRPSSDEIKAWRDLIDREECKSLPDVKRINFRIPKFTKKENNMMSVEADVLPFNHMEKKGGGVNFSKLTELENLESSDSKNKSEHIATSIKYRMCERKDFLSMNQSKFDGRNGVRRKHARIPSSLTPRVFIAGVVKNVDENKTRSRVKLGCDEEQKEESSLYCHKLRSSEGNCHKTDEYQKVCDQNSIEAKNGIYLADEDQNLHLEKRTVWKNRRINVKRASSGRETFDSLKNNISQNIERSETEKRRGSVVIKTLDELNSEDDDNDELGVECNYAESLINRNKKTKDEKLIGSNCTDLVMELSKRRKQILLETNPKHYINEYEKYEKRKSHEGSNLDVQHSNRYNDDLLEKHTPFNVVRPVACVAPVSYERRNVKIDIPERFVGSNWKSSRKMQVTHG